MKKILFHSVRYTTILFPIFFLIIVLGHTHYYTKRNKVIAANFSIQQTQQTQILSPAQLQKTIHQEGEKRVTLKITENHEWKNIIHQIRNGNAQWANLIPNLLPYAPIQQQQQLNHAILNALSIKPDIILQNLTLTHSTLNNIDTICQAPSLSQNKKRHLANVLKSVHNPSVIYQQQSCLHTLLKAINPKPSKIS